jgi:NADPH:quinone reductase-like Zn-dependent oxidoreductase
MNSKAAIQVEHGGPLVVDEIDIPDPGPDQVIMRNFASGVCYSQVHQLRDPAMPRPMGLGHEGSGVVTRVGGCAVLTGAGACCIRRRSGRASRWPYSALAASGWRRSVPPLLPVPTP